MKNYKAIALVAFTLLISIAVNTGSAVDNNCSKDSICTVVGAHYGCNSWSNEQYPVIDLFGEKNVPLVANYDPIWKCHVDKLAKLVLDSNATYTLKAGEKFDLGQGYALEAKQIDIDGMKVWLEFTKDGKYIADQIVSVNTDSNKTWTVALDDVQGENNIVVMKVYVNQLFAGALDNVVRIDGIWLIDYANARTLNTGDKIGGFTLQQIINGTNSSNLGSLIFKNTTESPVSCNVVSTSYECDSWSNEQYSVIDLFGEKNVPLVANYDPIWKCHVDKLARLVLDSGDKHTLKTGENLDLGQGYSIQAKQVDVDGKKVWLEFDKNGQYVDDQIISTGENWTCTLDKIQSEDHVPVLKAHVSDVYQSGDDSIVQIDGIWLIDYENARTLKSGDKIGGFTIEKIVNGTNSSNLGSLVFEKTTESPVSCNVVGTSYECSTWSNERYSSINLFGEKNVPLLANYDPIWKCHVDKLAKLVLDSGDKHTLKTGEKLDLCKGYSIQVKQIDIDGKKVWFEFDKNGKYVDDTILSTEPDNQNWTCSLDKIQGEDHVPVLKVHVSDVYQSGNDSIVQIDGIWLIDYENARTLKSGDKIGGFTLEKIVSGTNSSNLGSLVFEKAPG